MHKIIFDASGFRVVFDNLIAHSERDWSYWYTHVAMYTALRPDSPLAEVDKVFITTNDFINVAKYLKHHLAQLSIDDNFESPVFMPLEFSFQLQAFSGNVEADEGTFSVQFLLNIGKHPTNRTDIYVGAWANMNVKDARMFIASIEELIYGF